jgi:hypothetical protein
MWYNKTVKEKGGGREKDVCDIFYCFNWLWGLLFGIPTQAAIGVIKNGRNFLHKHDGFFGEVWIPSNHRSGNQYNKWWDVEQLYLRVVRLLFQIAFFVCISGGSAFAQVKSGQSLAHSFTTLRADGTAAAVDSGMASHGQ